MKPYYQIIPEKVFECLYVIEDLLKDEVKGYSRDNLLEVISIVACNLQKSNNKAPLKMEYIKKLVPQGDKYLLALISLGIVERSGFAIKGKVSYSYTFTQEYKSKYKTIPLNNAKLQHRIELIHNEIRMNNERSFRGLSQQVKFIKNLTLDDSYHDFINSNYSFNIDKYNSIVSSATRVLNGDFHYSRDDTSGRFHSNVTNMDKGLREYLRCHGKSLTNIDIKNSQPYLSIIILTNPGKVSWLAKNPAYALLLQTLKVSMKQDVKDYINFVISGQIYEYLMQEFAKDGLILSRTETKQQVLRILFARNRMPKDVTNKNARMIFKKRFPTVHKVFSKVRGNISGDKFINFKRFAILLQSIESYLMLDVILKRIYKELPGTIAITIHDSILTGVLTNDVEAVSKIMIEELTFFVGHRPQISIESKTEMERRLEKDERNKFEPDLYCNQYPATTLVMNSQSVI